MIKKLLPVVSCLALSACVGGTPVDLESRSISVEQNVESASATPDASVAHLLPATGPTYVTLTISQIENNAGGTREETKSAITSGSGFVVDNQGYVMTAAHVAVKFGNTVSARAANGRIYSGKVVTIMPDNDMALIKLRGFKGHAVAPVSNACLAPGSKLFSLGKPHAQGDTARIGTLQTMSFGRPVKYGKFGYPDAMVMSMNTQKGKSGGPVFDGNGRLAGMVVSTLSDGNGKSLNLAHAVPSATLAGFLCSSMTCSASWSALAQHAGQTCAIN